MLKKMLDIVDKPTIQYIVEETIESDIIIEKKSKTIILKKLNFTIFAIIIYL